MTFLRNRPQATHVKRMKSARVLLLTACLLSGVTCPFHASYAQNKDLPSQPPISASLQSPESARVNDSIADTVTAMARIGRVSSPSFSSDGTRIAFVSDLNGSPQVWIIDSHGGYPQLVTTGTEPVISVRWSPVDRTTLAFMVAPGGGENTQIYVVRPDGTGLKRLTAGGKDNNKLEGWSPDGRYIRFGSNARDPTAFDPYLLDPVSGQMERLRESAGNTAFTDVSVDGRFGLLSRQISRGDNNLYLFRMDTHREVLLTPHKGPGDFDGALHPDGRTIYLASNNGRDLKAFTRLQLSAEGTPGPTQIIAARDDAELDNFVLNEQGTLAALRWDAGGRSDVQILDLPSGKEIQHPSLPSEVVTGFTFSADGKRLAMTLTGARSPHDLWVLDVQSGTLQQLTFSPHAGVDLTQLVSPELVTFKAHDGLTLTGWLYRPKGSAGHQPYVIGFHGGPEAQERPSFRSDYQALLSQGIGVFAPNVRGSDGFGKRFVNLDNGPLRVNAIRDIKACYDFLVVNGIADARRIGIMGGSYGGYMTMAALTEYPDLFAAGVDLYGIVNFETFFSHSEPWMAKVSTVEYGDPVRDAALLRSLSPINKLDRIKAPLMVQHGANDTNVPVIEAEQIVGSLRARNVPVEYLLFPDDGHAFRKTANRMRSTISLVGFFVKQLAATN